MGAAAKRAVATVVVLTGLALLLLTVLQRWPDAVWAVLCFWALFSVGAVISAARAGGAEHDDDERPPLDDLL